MKREFGSIEPYLASTEVIDSKSPAIGDVVQSIVPIGGGEVETARRLVSKFAAAINLDTSALGERSTDFSFSLVSNGDGTDNLFLNYQGLPEPGSATLFGLGIAAPLLARRKRPPPKPA